MLALPGNLESATLGDILGDLHRQSVSGALRLTEWIGGPREHSILWRCGLIHSVESPAVVTSLSDLIAQQMSAAGFAPGQNPRSGGLFFCSVLQSARKTQCKERLEHLFGLQRARLKFGVAGGATSVRSPRPLQPMEFLHGRPRLRDTQLFSRNSPRPSSAAAIGKRRQFQADLVTLGLGETASLGDVRSQFRDLARRWHPDLHAAADEQRRAGAERRFARLVSAYQRLSEQLERQSSCHLQDRR